LHVFLADSKLRVPRIIEEGKVGKAHTKPLIVSDTQALAASDWHVVASLSGEPTKKTSLGLKFSLDASRRVARAMGAYRNRWRTIEIPRRWSSHAGLFRRS